MRRIALRKGLTVPIAGAPEPRIDDAPPARRVALLGRDHPDLRPRILVEPGQAVRLGEAVVEDRRLPGVVLTAPAGGVVDEVERGPRRRLGRLTIRVEEEAAEGAVCDAHSLDALARLSRREVVDALLRSGLWTALRARPFERIPSPVTEPASIFVTAMDTRPLAPDVDAILHGAPDAFRAGVRVVATLTSGPVFVCCRSAAALADLESGPVQVVEFAGPHPAGLVGTHIHHLDPVGAHKRVWHIGYPDVIAVGRLFLTGRLSMERVIAWGGPAVGRPRMLRTRLGAALEDLVRAELRPELDPGEVRVVSGGVLHGDRALAPDAFLGRYHDQVAVLAEGTPAAARRLRAAASRWALGRTPPRTVTTARHGRPSALVAADAYERVLPMDVLAVPLLRALQVGDLEQAEALGCLELAEEDLALLTYVCPAKTDHGPALRAALDALARER